MLETKYKITWHHPEDHSPNIYNCVFKHMPKLLYLQLCVIYGFIVKLWPINFGKGIKCQSEQGSSVSIVSGYGQEYRAIQVRSPAEAKGFFL
jgi:hypothetical protein